MESFLEAEVPETLCRHLFLSFVKKPSAVRGGGIAAGDGGAAATAGESNAPTTHEGARPFPAGAGPDAGKASGHDGPDGGRHGAGVQAQGLPRQHSASSGQAISCACIGLPESGGTQDRASAAACQQATSSQRSPRAAGHAARDEQPADQTSGGPGTGAGAGTNRPRSATITTAITALAGFHSLYSLHGTFKMQQVTYDVRYLKWCSQWFREPSHSHSQSQRREISMCSHDTYVLSSDTMNSFRLTNNHCFQHYLYS